MTKVAGYPSDINQLNQNNMETRFYVGQKVVCIDTTVDTNYFYKLPLKKNETYTIMGIKIGHCNRVVIDVGIENISNHSRCAKCLQVFLNEDSHRWFFAARFAPIDEIPASHEKAIKELLETELILS